MGWFLTPSDGKRAAARPMAQVGGLMALVVAAFAAGSVAAEPMRDASSAVIGSRLDVVVKGRITPRCQMSGGGDVDLGELSGGESVSALFALDCNVPFDISMQSSRGGLAHVSQPQGEGPFVGLLPYDMRLTIPTLRPSPATVQASFTSTQMIGGRTLSSGDGIAAGGGKLELRTRKPEGAGLLAGRYSEALTLTVTPRM